MSTSLNTPVPVLENSLSRSHGIVSGNGESARASSGAVIALPSVDVQLGPAPCVPTAAKLVS